MLNLPNYSDIPLDTSSASNIINLATWLEMEEINVCARMLDWTDSLPMAANLEFISQNIIEGNMMYAVM